MVDVYLVGVGGQGIITATRMIGDAAVLEHKKALLSETHGMAQRGGSVSCTARIGDSSSPLIAEGSADVILSFELLETLKAIDRMSEKTIVITSTERIVPLSVSTKGMKYPSLEEIRSQIEGVSRKFVSLDAPKLAEEVGVPISSNVVMVGALAGTGITGISRHSFEESLKVNIPTRMLENKAAFSKGFEIGAAVPISNENSSTHRN